MLKKTSLVMLIGILLLAAIPAAAQETITIASGNFAEPQLLAEAIKILIEENTDLTVDHVRNFSGSSLLHSAFLAGDVDLYISYTGTQFTGVLGMEVTDDWKNREKVEKFVQEEFAKQFDATWFDAFGFNNTYTIAVRREFAEEHNLTNVSDLKDLAPSMTIAMDNIFRERAGDGYNDLCDTYGFRFRRPVSMDYGLMYRSVASGDVDAAITYSTDGRIPAMDLVTLEDDLEFFPPYDGAVIARNIVLETHPEISELIQPLLGNIDVEAIQRYNQMVDVDHLDVEDVAQILVKEVVLGNK